MTVTWLDPPDVELGSARDAIDFMVDREVVAISVSFNRGPVEERAYRDGAFLPRYLGSTRQGNTFSLRRTGGWPSSPTVYVDEAPVAPVPPQNGATWGAIYEAEFSGLPYEEFAPGPVQIDGLTWYLKGSLVDQWGVASTAGTGDGIRIRTSYSPATEIQSLTVPNPTLRWFLPFAQLPLYNPLAPTIVQWRGTSSEQGYRKLVAGFLDGTNDAVGPLRGPNQDHSTQISSVNGTGAFSYRGGRDKTSSGVEESMLSIGPSQTFENSQFAAIAVAPAISMVSKAPWSGSFLAPAALEALNHEAAIHRKPGAAAPLNLGFQLCVRDTAGGVMHSYGVTHLRVMQPRPQ